MSVDRGVLTCQLFIILAWQKTNFTHCPFSVGILCCSPLLHPICVDWLGSSYTVTVTCSHWTWCSSWQRGRIRLKRVQRLPAKDLLGLLQVVRSIVLCCWWLVCCGRVWLLHTWRSWDMVGISKAIMQKVQTWTGEMYWWHTLHTLFYDCSFQDLKCKQYHSQNETYILMWTPFKFIWFVTESSSRQVWYCIHYWSSQGFKYSQKFIYTAYSIS